MTRRIKNILVVSLAAVLAGLGTPALAVPGLGSLPLYFEPGTAPKDGAVQFLARSHDGQVLVSSNGACLTLRDRHQVQMKFLGASDQAQIHGEEELAGKINYLTGNDPAQWRTGIPMFAKVRIANLYPGIDEVYYGNQSQLEYDFNVAAGASPEHIVMQFAGAEKISVNASGELVLSLGPGEIYQPKPVIYQTVAGVRQEIAGGYQIMDAKTVGFAIGHYNHDLPLVIDPILSYSSYFGGNLDLAAQAVVLDTNDGSIFIAGQTLSTNVATANVFQSKYQGGSVYGDAFVAKFNQHGTNLVYLTYLGGSKEDSAITLAVDKAGNAFVAGLTDSPNFPITTITHPIPGVATNIQGSIVAGEYPFDGFVSELSTNGASLIYSTYLGGSGSDAVYGLAIDGEDNAYVTGYTYSPNFPVTNAIPFVLKGRTNQFLNTLGATNNLYYNCNGFIAKIHAGGSNLDVSSFFGGNNLDAGTGIAVDGANNVYVTGFTSSTNFPNTNAFQSYINDSNYWTGAFDAFVAKLTPTTTNLNLVYSSYLGRDYDDVANYLAIDSQGAAYVAGWTVSTNFYNSTPNLIHNFATNNVTGSIYTTNAFLTKVTQASPTNAAQMAYSVVFGGSRIDIADGVAVDPAGNAFVTGFTTSPDFPGTNTLGYLKPVTSGSNDAFVVCFNTNCTKVLYAVCLGGTADDFGYAIAVDANSTAYVVGQTASPNFPVTSAITNLSVYSARQTSLSSTNDSFLAQISMAQYHAPLTISAVKTNLVTVSWPEYAQFEPIALQSTTNLALGSWITVTNLPVLTNNLHVLTLRATNQYQFFRLTN